MALTELSYPVTQSGGLYNNIFPSQQRLSFKLKRIDTTVVSVSSGTDNSVNIVTALDMTGLEQGDYVCWGTDSYSNRCSKVINLVSSTEIEVDEIFFSSDATNGFVNFKENWFCEVRFIDESTTSNSQTALEIVDDYTQVPSSISGDVDINISYPSQLLSPDFELSTGANEGFSQVYKIQYRESWTDNRSNNWASPSSDIPIMLVLGSENIYSTGFTDFSLMKRFVKGYPLIYSFTHSDVNDLNGNLLRVDLVQYNIQKKVISTGQVFDQFNVNGVYLFKVDASQIDDETAFIEFSGQITGDIGQYNSAHYDPTQYDTG